MGLIEELKKKKARLEAELQAINLLLGESNPDEGNVVVESPSFSADLTEELKNASQHEMFLIVLKEAKRFMKIREIASFLVSILGGNEREWSTKLSRITGKLKKAGKIKAFKVGKSNTNVFWGSPNWIDEKGNIKDQFMYDESAVDKPVTFPDI